MSNHPERLRRVALALLAAVPIALGSGCQTLELEVVDAPHSRVIHERKSFFFGGLFPRQRRVDVSLFCPGGVARVHEETTSDDVLVSVATFGLWTPRSSWYYCLHGRGTGDDWMVELPFPGAFEAPFEATDPETTR